MTDSRLQQFAASIADWSLDDEWLATVLAQIPRAVSEEPFVLTWQGTSDGEPMLVLGSQWTALSGTAQRAHTRLLIHHLLLGHLTIERDWPEDQVLPLALFGQAFHYLPASLQQVWPDWQLPWNALELTAYPDLETIKLVLEVQQFLERFPDFGQQLDFYQSFWRQPFGKKKNTNYLAQRLTRQLSMAAHLDLGSWQVWVSLSQKNRTIALPWTQVLRRQIRRYRHRALDFTHKRISKRYGTSPGIRFKKEASIGVALDTSASVPEEIFAQFYQELELLYRMGHQIQVVEIDMDIRAVYPFQPGLQGKAMEGRGNTSYDPAITYFSLLDVDLLLYFTDGLGPRPLVEAHLPIIWVVMNRYTELEFLREKMEDWPGEKVFIKPEDNTL